MNQSDPPTPPTPSTPPTPLIPTAPLTPPTPSTSLTPSTPPAPARKAYERKPSGPKRVRNGIKLRVIKDHEPSSPIATRWMQLVRKLIDGEEFDQGYEYAKAGQIRTIDIERGKLLATVQGVSGKPYSTNIHLEQLDEAHWRRLIARMATEAISSARLLAAQHSEERHDAFEKVEIELVPPESEAIQPECTCPRPKPCRHFAAVAYILADRLETDPALIFTLRGMPYDELLDRLRHERLIHSRGVATTHVDPMIPETQRPTIPIEECLDDFWRVGRELSELEQSPPEPHVAHALLRRLGPSPLKGKFPMVGLMASIYDTVAQHATDLRDRAEGMDRSDTVDQSENPVDNGEPEQLG